VQDEVQRNRLNATRLLHVILKRLSLMQYCLIFLLNLFLRLRIDETASIYDDRPSLLGAYWKD
jgi:hypothetical protein